MRRFYRPGARAHSSLPLSPEETAHMRQVLRIPDGASVVVFDGAGDEYEAVVHYHGSDGSAFCETGVRIDSASELPVRVRLYQAVIKGDHFEYAVQKSTEAGVTSIVAFISERCVKIPGNPERFLERANRKSVEAAKQCGRSVAPPVEGIVTFEELVREIRDVPAVAAYEKEHAVSFRAYMARGCPEELNLIVGPEGGFTETEVGLLQRAGAQCVSLGPRILRSESAGPHMLAQISYACEL